MTLSRDVEAVIVPAGTAITLKAGLSGFITQALGGSFTLYIEGNLYRIPGAEADAIGKEPRRCRSFPRAADEDVRDLAWSQMSLLRPGDSGQHRRSRARLCTAR